MRPLKETLKENMSTAQQFMEHSILEIRTRSDRHCHFEVELGRAHYVMRRKWMV